MSCFVDYFSEFFTSTGRQVMGFTDLQLVTVIAPKLLDCVM